MITHRDLDTKMYKYYNKPKDDWNLHTFREYIKHSEDRFGMYHCNIRQLSELELNEYIEFLNDFWKNY